MSIFTDDELQNDIIDNSNVLDNVFKQDYGKYEKTLHKYIKEMKGNIYYNYYCDNKDENTGDITWKFGYERYRKIDNYTTDNEDKKYRESLNYSIILPTNFILDSPVLPNYFDIQRHKEMEQYLSTFNNIYRTRLFMYSPRKVDDESDTKYSEYIIKDKDVDSLFSFDIPEDINIVDIVFRGSFDTFDTYYKFINICKQKFPNTHIWFNYETKVINDKVKLTKNYLLTYLNSTRMNPDKILDNGNIKISYTPFPNDGFLTKD